MEIMFVNVIHLLISKRLKLKNKNCNKNLSEKRIIVDSIECVVAQFSYSVLIAGCKF